MGYKRFLFLDGLPILFVADETDVILAPIYSERAAFAGGVFLVGVPINLIAALFTFVAGLGFHGFVWHMVLIIPEGGLNSNFFYAPATV